MGNGFLVAYYLAKKVGKSTLAHPTQVCPMNQKTGPQSPDGGGWEKVWLKEEGK